MSRKFMLFNLIVSWIAFTMMVLGFALSWYWDQLALGGFCAIGMIFNGFFGVMYWLMLADKDTDT